eukprot:COSAG02_NODE_412_length_22836_cov_41.209966_9_plen_160_part_00
MPVDFRKPSSGGGVVKQEEELPEVLFQGWLQKKAGATSKGTGKNALKKAAAGWDKRWFEVRSRNGGQFAKNPFKGSSVGNSMESKFCHYSIDEVSHGSVAGGSWQVRWLTDVTAEKPQKELALAEAGLFLAEKMTSGFTLICPTGEKQLPTTEVSESQH